MDNSAVRLDKNDIVVLYEDDSLATPVLLRVIEAYRTPAYIAEG
jgi:hypothetical protein